MSGQEFLIRAVIAGTCIGVPAFILRLLTERKGSLPRPLILTVGGVAGTGAGFAATSGLAPPWAPAVFYSLFIGLATSVCFGVLIGVIQEDSRR